LAILKARGRDVAGYLRALFDQHGAPLFLKRDNGSIFNHRAVDAVLAEHCVIPLTVRPAIRATTAPPKRPFAK